jgi:hypothetical protein
VPGCSRLQNGSHSPLDSNPSSTSIPECSLYYHKALKVTLSLTIVEYSRIFD